MIRSKGSLKFISQLLLWSFVFQLFAPSTAWALTGGPSQPEVQSFQPASLNSLVDPFTGDFSYNIPLVDVGGYPINLSYNSGISMDQEASWVGLGWNINPGAITRNTRGVPDDFQGDEIRTEFNMKRNETYSYRTSLGAQIFGYELMPDVFTDKNDASGLSVSQSLGLTYNNYNGVSIDISAGASFSLDFLNSGQSYGNTGMGLNLSASGDDGLDISPSVSFSAMKNKATANLNSSFVVNSRRGLKGLTNSMSVTQKINEKNKPSLMTGGYTSFLPNTYTPQISMPFQSGNIGASFKAGGELFGGRGTVDVSGTYSFQDLKVKQKNSPAFGYTHLEDALNMQDATMDFNRERDKAFDRYTTNLPVTNLTYDLYSVSGQGLTGMFRSFRSDVGYVKDPTTKNSSFSANAGFGFSAGNLTGVDVDLGGGFVRSESGFWSDNNDALGLKFKGAVPNTQSERYYFAMVGEPAIDGKSANGNSVSPWYSNAVHGNQAIRVDLTGSDYDVKASNSFAYNDFSTHTFSSIEREHRKSRSQHVGSFTISQMKDYVEAGGYYSGITDVNRLGSSVARDHHIGQFTITKTDGSQYVYGIPVYNYNSKDVSFNASGLPVNCATGLVSYNAKDASVNNERGQDEFFQSVRTPAHAHSYLISEILSSDYSDNDNVLGPSPEDLGTYYKFEYTTVDNYKWRVPFSSYKASFDPAMHSKAYDDRAHYSYGEKEIKYLHKISSKTHVAIFHTDDLRHDSKGVKGEEGGYDASLSESMHRLTRISLYGRKDYEANGVNAIPIKEVHFVYDHSLCQGITNNPNFGGKLTLKKVYFTYGDSYKAMMNPYIFTYADINHDGMDNDGANPNYDIKAYDRWGNYSPNNLNKCAVGDGHNRSSFPYTAQDRVVTDTYTAAWSLSEIQTPSGGIIQVDYESDDYRFVQNKRAKVMVPVVGAGEEPGDYPSNATNFLYDGNSPAPYFYINTEALDSDDNVDSLKAKYFSDITDNPVLFKFLMTIPKPGKYASGSSNHRYSKEFVTGYLRVEEVGFVPGQGKDYAYVKVSPVKKGDKSNDPLDAHPVSVTTWNYTRETNPDLAYSRSPKNASFKPAGLSSNMIDDVLYELIDVFESLAEAIVGANSFIRLKGMGKEFEIGASWLRLDAPTPGKLGGGHRVTKVAISDSWDNMAGGNEAVYGQEFEYRMPNGRSSGVAAYEPTIGNEENPFRMPMLAKKEGSNLYENEDYLMVPKRYQEGPFGESFFPNPTVGYRRVIIKDILPSNVTQHGTGKTIKEFYTSREFPTRLEQTTMEVQHRPPSWLANLFKFYTKEHMSTGQGYVIIKNDMHGKPKAEWVYAEGQKKPQSGVEYRYKTKGRNQLNNRVKALHENNVISQNLELGVSYDLVNDFRQFNSESFSFGADFNLETFMVGVIPIVVPILIPSGYSQIETQYRTAVTTKVINQFGVLKETIIHNEEAKSKSENLVWDGETGNTVLTKINDKYDEEVYNFSMPAHLPYPSMGGVYQNQGFSLENLTLKAKEPFIKEGDSHFEMFHPGDELLIKSNAGHPPLRAWVIEGEFEFPIQSGLFVKSYYLIDKEGDPIPSNPSMQGVGVLQEHDAYDNTSANITVFGSGRGNMLASAGSFTFKGEPFMQDVLSNETLKITQEGVLQTEVISAEAHTFSDQWQGKSNRLFTEGSQGFGGFDLEPNAAIQSSHKTVLEKLLKYLASSGALSQANGGAALVESDIIANSNISATEFKELCTNLYGCTNDGFVQDIFSFNNSLPEVTVSVEWALESEAYHKAPNIVKAPVCYIKLERDNCVGLYMSLVTNLCDAEFDYDSGGAITKIKSANTITAITDVSVKFREEIGAVFYSTRQADPQGEYLKYRYCMVTGEFVRSNPSATISCTSDKNILYSYYGNIPNRYAIDFGATFPSGDNRFRVGQGPAYLVDGLRRQLRTHDVSPQTIGVLTGLYYNPYVENARGNWRAKAQFLPLKNRNSSSHIRDAGTFYCFPYWYYSSTMGWQGSGNNSLDWTYTSEISKHHPNGESVESTNALGIKNSVLLDDEDYVKATAQNAAHGQVLSLDFEDNTYGTHPEDDISKMNLYFGYETNADIPAKLSTLEKHSGKKSLRITPGALSLSKVFAPAYYSNVAFTTRSFEYVYPQLDKERLGNFFQVNQTLTEPLDERYLLSYWMKGEGNQVLDENDLELQLICYDSGESIVTNSSQAFVNSSTLIQVGKPINGWQKVEYIIEVNPLIKDNSWIDIKLENKLSSSSIYLDDFRIHPLDGAMLAYVYDKSRGRLMAQLDENNYATYYEYDLEGNLVRLKKETERGIQTIQENRQSLLK
ncbi:MAG: hypothetical protein NXI09_15555 [Bacteroidetes bacterium]|nr:hypothetical protein [Bacteroidota bacterium]